MGAPDILMRLAGAGIRLRPLPDGRLWAGPRAALTDDLRVLIRQHRTELLQALSDPTPDPLPDPAAERVLRLLAENPTAKYAVVSDSEIDPEFVLLTLAIRGKATCEIHVPRDRYDGPLILDLIEKHGETVH